MNNEILKKLVEALPVGKENAIHLEDLAVLLNDSPEHTKVLVRQARMQGMLLISGQAGYWLSNDREEIMIFILSLEKESRTHYMITTAMRRGLEVLDGQLLLPDQETDI